MQDNEIKAITTSYLEKINALNLDKDTENKINNILGFVDKEDVKITPVEKYRLLHRILCLLYLTKGTENDYKAFIAGRDDAIERYQFNNLSKSFTKDTLDRNLFLIFCDSIKLNAYISKKVKDGGEKLPNDSVEWLAYMLINHAKTLDSEVQLLSEQEIVKIKDDFKNFVHYRQIFLAENEPPEVIPNNPEALNKFWLLNALGFGINDSPEYEKGATLTKKVYEFSHYRTPRLLSLV